MIKREINANSYQANRLVVGTNRWTAPEILSATMNSVVPEVDYFKADVFSFGIISK
jgi:hypothetical protein